MMQKVYKSRKVIVTCLINYSGWLRLLKVLIYVFSDLTAFSTQDRERAR